jgi:hypothetical protein
MNFDNLKDNDKFYSGLQELFKSLKIPVNYIDEKSLAPEVLLETTFKPHNDSHKLINDIYILGMVDDAAFKGEKSVELSYIKNDYEGILIFGVELKNRSNGLLPSRGQLAEVTRAFNREFKHLPVVVVYRYDSYITIANAERMKYDQKWREGEKIGKVILIKDINVEKTHRAHIDILDDLKVKAKVIDFKSLNEHWLKVLNSSELNKKFYQELSNWYFWALDHVSFPDDIEKNKDVRNATNLIRLITRVIFIWFIKEKDLVPESLFDEQYVSKILKEYKKDKSSVYYQAILQNMFFGTLNQKMNERKFAQNGNITVNKKEYGIKNLYRYQEMFNLPENDIIKLFAEIPFLNGGLFDCLDRIDGTYMDGFSRNPKKRAQVQDFLFFCSENEYDLNQIYGTKNKKYKVRGLIDILNSYKFTIAENTPIEEEVALDPELLGKVFENLLASYNPETQTTARKQTGSFYTPREIVNYMVDESLKEYLKQNLKDKLNIEEDEIDLGLDILFNYVEVDTHPYIDKERKTLIDAIDNCKILDPACGSGAFPMGVLHKLVYILNKLDPGNELWKDRQIEKINVDDPNLKEKMVADVNEAFMNNELDFGRKLYLIENCIYGVDIQPIAIQISKLRFFISLIVDQKVDKTKENLGIRSLPNLETKFVAANTLIGLDKPQQQLLHNPEIDDLEDEIKENRHNYFSANTRKLKLSCQEKDKQLREKISKLLEEEGWSHKTAEQIVAFDPYDQNISSPFFDPEWMFGIKEGFDVVIGNPPYGHSIKEKKEYFKKCYVSAEGKHEIYKYFIEKGLSLLRIEGMLSFISSDTWTSLGFFKKLRQLIYKNYRIKAISKSLYNVFETATVDTNIYLIKKASPSKNYTLISGDLESGVNRIFDLNEEYVFNLKDENLIIKKIERTDYVLGDLCEIWQGLIAYGKKNQPREFTSYKKETNLHRKLLYGGDISRYGIKWSGEYLKYGDWLHRPRPSYIYDNEKILVQRIRNPQLKNRLVCAIDNCKFLNGTGSSNILLKKNKINLQLKYLLPLLNSKIINYWFSYYFSDVNIKPEQLRKIPIRTTKYDKNIISIVDKILLAKEENIDADTSLLENKIDSMIYKLYNLNYDEVKIIDPEIEKIISKEEYGKMVV